MREKAELSKIFFLSFYLIAMVIAVFYAWNSQNEILRGGGTPLFRNLMESPAYIRRGFDPGDILKIPPQDSANWVRFQSAPLRVKDSPLPDLPRRRFLSPRGKDAEEFTIIIPVEMDSRAMEYLNDDLSILPGIFFSCVGENWEIFFNGTLVRSEMHLDEAGRILSRRTWRDVHFPLESSLFVPGTNILALRIVGDPAYNGTGLFYTAPHYIEDYRIIKTRHINFLLIVLSGVFGFTGIYFLMFFLSTRQKQEIFNLYFSISSFLLCAYSIARNGMVNHLIPNSDISIRIEYFSMFLLAPVLGIFIESLGRKKITKPSWFFLGFCILLGITQIFFCSQFGDETLAIWNVTALAYILYVFFYDIVYFYFWEHRKSKSHKDSELLDLSITNVLISSVLIVVSSIYDILDVLFFHNSFHLFLHSTFVFYIGMALTLSQQFRGMYNRLEQSNVMLETAVSQRTQELEEQTRIAVEANRAKSKFLATMSHEIRTPLNAVIGLSEIELRGNLPDSSKDNIQQIHQSGSSLLGIINDILDISKIEAGNFELVAAEYESAIFIGDIINLGKAWIASKPINVVLEVGGDFPKKLFGDELRIKQVLNNLLSNAIKYTHQGTVTLSINSKLLTNSELSTENSESGVIKEVLVRFTIRDTGIGIREEDIKKLFMNYIQLDARANRKVEGTGLGLVICKNLVEMMGGNITVESEYGRGSIFTVEIVQGLVDSTELPYEPMGDEIAEDLKNFRYAKKRAELDIARIWVPNGKVLIVDDMPVNIKVAKGLLKPYGLSADSAISGQKAIELVKAENSKTHGTGGYDIVFMDHMMPEMDGIETMLAIRAWENEQNTKNSEQGKENIGQKRQLPIIALTANAVLEMQEKFIEKGFNGILTKPIDVIKLDEVLNRWIPEEQKVQRFGDSNKNSEEKKLIFLVDDNSEILRRGRNILVEKYAVFTMSSAAKLFAFLESAIPALILLDTDMPDMDGYQALKILKSNPQTKDIPVIFLTEGGHLQTAEDPLARGAVDCVSKPFYPQALIACIEKQTASN